MKPPNEEGENVRVWRFEKNRIYSVRSAYRRATELRGTLLNLHEVGPWNKLWNMAIPPKSKHLLWRILKRILPTPEVLRWRGVDIEDVCGCCSAEGESIEHVLFDCPIATDCWRHSGLDHGVSQLQGFGEDARRWVFELVSSGAELFVQNVATIVWTIWRERNERVWQGKSMATWVVARKGLDDMQEWKAAQELKHVSVPPRVEVCPQWHVPEADYVKCNVDIAIFVEERSSGVGMAVRDQWGHFLHVLMQRRAWFGDPRELEMEGLVDAIMWMQSMGYKQVVFESDNQEVIHAINGQGVERSEFGVLAVRGRNLLQSEPLYKANWVRRNRNEIAHELARRSRFNASTYMGVTPPFDCERIVNSFCTDLTH